jgi:hypothetical protein
VSVIKQGRIRWAEYIVSMKEQTHEFLLKENLKRRAHWHDLDTDETAELKQTLKQHK